MAAARNDHAVTFDRNALADQAAACQELIDRTRGEFEGFAVELDVDHGSCE
jgi:hypothetical protein